MLRLLLFILLSLGTAHAQMMQGQAGAAKKKFSGFAMASASTNAYEIGSVNDQTESAITAMFNYKLEGKNSLRTTLSIQKELSGERESQFTGGWFGLHRSGVYTGEYMSTAFQLRILAPLSENDRKNTARTTGVSTAFLSPINLAKMGMTNSSLFWIANFTKNINEFETSATGDPNTEFQLANTMIYSYYFTDKFGVNLTGSYVKARNYFGRLLDDVYELSQEIAYSFTPALTVGLGHSNGGQLMNNQLGADREIQIYDGRNDSYYVYLFYTF